jgi:hypothetical protein
MDTVFMFVFSLLYPIIGYLQLDRFQFFIAGATAGKSEFLCSSLAFMVSFENQV